MFYLVNCDTHGCVDFQAFIGISSMIKMVLWNFYLIFINNLCQDTHYDLQIYKINEENYNYLSVTIQNNN